MARVLDPLRPSTSSTGTNELRKTCKSDSAITESLVELKSSIPYKAISYLGKGGFAKCYAAVGFLNHKSVALKVIAKNRLREHAQLDKVRKEIVIHRALSHANIVKLLESFEDDVNMYMVLEHCENDTLFSAIKYATDARLDESVARSFLSQIVDSVLYLHEEAFILHRDLKPGNILLTASNQIKLADFGLAIHIADLDEASLSVLRREGHSKESEAWSIGCTYYCMLVGKPPFETETIEKTYAKITACEYGYPSDLLISIVAKDIVARLLDPNTITRMRISEIKDHPLFTVPHACKLKSAESKNSREKQIYLNELECVLPTVGHSGDSGIGSDGFLNTRPRSSTDARSLFQQIVSGRFKVTNEVPRSPDEHLIMISKWVDYTNKYGFGCFLSEETYCILFTDNSSMSFRKALNDDTFQFLLINDVWQDPLSMNEWKQSDVITDPLIARKMRISNLFKNYMDRELQTTYEHKKPVQQLDALICQKRCENLLVMFLAMGTVQVNFLDTHEKLVFSRDSSNRISMAVFSPTDGINSYSLVPCTDSYAERSWEQYLLAKIRRTFINELSMRSILATEC